MVPAIFVRFIDRRAGGIRRPLGKWTLNAPLDVSSPRSSGNFLRGLKNKTGAGGKRGFQKAPPVFVISMNEAKNNERNWSAV